MKASHPLAERWVSLLASFLTLIAFALAFALPNQFPQVFPKLPFLFPSPLLPFHRLPLAFAPPPQPLLANLGMGGEGEAARIISCQPFISIAFCQLHFFYTRMYESIF